MEWQAMYREEIGGRLMTFRQTDSYTDVKVKAGAAVFSCHRVILAAMSSFFDASFQSGMMESLSGEISIPYDESTTRDLLAFIYTGKCDVTKDNAFHLYHAANFFQIPSLLKLCESTLRAGISKESCFAVWRTAMLHDCHDIEEKAKVMVLQNFKTFVTEDDMSDLGYPELISLIEDPYLNCGEVTKCKAALLWLVVDLEERQTKTETLMRSLLSKANVTERVLTVEIDNLPIAFKSRSYEELGNLQTACRQVLDTAKSMTPSNMALAVSTNYQYTDESLVILGGEDRGPGNSLRRFSYRQQKWFDLNPFPSDPGFECAICALEGKLYLTGGNENSKRLEEYDSRSGTWCHLPEMPVGRRGHAMGAIPGKGVYVLAGVDSRVIHRDVHLYDPTGKTWRTCGRLYAPVKAPVYVTSGDNIVLLGGSDLREGENLKPSSIAQYYDTKHNHGCSLEFKLPFESKIFNFCAASVAGKIYAVTCRDGKGTVYLVHEKLKAEKVGEIDNCPVRQFGCVAYGNKLLIIGGLGKNFQMSNEMIQYNLETRVSTSLPTKLPVPLVRFLCDNVTFR